MRSKRKTFFSFLFLFAFLIPTVGNSLHELSHAKDFHCNEKSAHHFHEEEHHCIICDFSFSNYYSDISSPEVSARNFSILPYYFSNTTILFFEEVTVLALRGPPTV